MNYEMRVRDELDMAILGVGLIIRSRHNGSEYVITKVTEGHVALEPLANSAKFYWTSIFNLRSNFDITLNNEG